MSGRRWEDVGEETGLLSPAPSLFLAPSCKGLYPDIARMEQLLQQAVAERERLLQARVRPSPSSPRPRSPDPQPLLSQMEESETLPLGLTGTQASAPWHSLRLQGWAASFPSTSLQAPLSPLLPAPHFSDLCP